MENDLKSSEQVRAKFVEISTPMIRIMSDKLVTSVNDVLKQTSTKFKPQKFEEKFKTDMLEKWIDEFNTMWNARNLTERLTTLNALKQQHNQNGLTEKAWRAHGHTAKEQTQSNRNRVMSLHLLHVQELLEQQSNDLQKFIFEVEERRSYFNEVSKRRIKTLEEMDTKMNELWGKLNDTEPDAET